MSWNLIVKLFKEVRASFFDKVFEMSDKTEAFMNLPKIKDCIIIIGTN